MLVVGRKVGEGVFVGDGVRLVVLRIEQGQVTLGFDAPVNIAVSRDDFGEAEHRKRQDERRGRTE